MVPEHELQVKPCRLFGVSPAKTSHPISVARKIGQLGEISRFGKTPLQEMSCSIIGPMEEAGVSREAQKTQKRENT